MLSNKNIFVAAWIFSFATVSLFATESVRTITGTVRDAEQRPMENAAVYCWNEAGIIGRAASDAEGCFTLNHPADQPLQYVFAVKSGCGLDYVFTDETPGMVERREYGEMGNPAARKQTDGPFSLILDPSRTVKIRMLDPEGSPLEGIRVSPLMEKAEVWFDDWFYRFQKPDAKNMLLFPPGEPVAELVKITGPDGWVEFDCYPEWGCDRHVRFAAADTSSPPRFLPKEMHYRPRTQRPKVIDEVFLVLERAVPVSGTIRLPDGTPVAGCEITKSFRSRLGVAAAADEQGRFVFYLPPNVSFNMNLNTKPVRGEFWTLPEMHELKTGEAGIADLDLTLKKGGRVHGRATAGKNKEPIEGEFMVYWIMKIEDAAHVRNSTFYCGKIDKGLFERVLPPGKYSISVHFQGQDIKTEFEIAENENQAIDLHFAKFEPIQRRTVTLRTVLDEAGEFAVPETDLWFWSDQLGPFHLSEKIKRLSDENGSYRLSAINRSFFVKAISRDGKFGKLQRIEPHQETINIVLEPAATLKLRCVDAEQNPVPGLLLRSSVRRAGTESYNTEGMFSEDRKTNENGEIKYMGLSGGEWDLMYATFTRDDLRRDQVHSMMSLPVWKPVPGETEERTEEVKPAYSGRDEFLQVFYNRYRDTIGSDSSPVEQRFPTFLSAARIDERIPFAFFLSLESPKLQERIEKFFNIVYGDRELLKAYERYTLFGIQTNQKSWNPNEPAGIVEAREFARRRGIDPETIDEPTVCLLDTGGNCRATKKFEDFYSIGIDPETKEDSVNINREVFFGFFKP